MIRRLERTVASPPDKPAVGNADHPMRKVTRQIAFEPGGWTPERMAKVVELFDGLAPDWDARFQSAETQTPLCDALSARTAIAVGSWKRRSISMAMSVASTAPK